MIKTAHFGRNREQDSAVTERNEEELTEAARATAEAGANVAREGLQLGQRAGNVAADLHETTRALAEESPQVGRDFADLLGEQTRQSVDTLGAFARAVNWTDVAQAQSELVAGSLLRISQFNARYGEFLLRGMTAAQRLARR